MSSTIKSKKGIGHLNLARSLKELSVPQVGKNFLSRDRRRLSQILKSGKLPPVDWSKVKKDYKSSLRQLFHQETPILFININQNSPDFEASEVSVDELLVSSGSSGCVVHGETLVYMATFTPETCVAIASLAWKETGMSYSCSDEALEGIRDIGNTDTMQAKETAVYTANFGVTC